MPLSSTLELAKMATFKIYNLPQLEEAKTDYTKIIPQENDKIMLTCCECSCKEPQEHNRKVEDTCQRSDRARSPISS